MRSLEKVSHTTEDTPARNESDKGFYSAWKEFYSSSSMHGLQNVCTSVGKRKLIWSICFLISLSLSVVLSVNSILQYYEYKTTITISNINEQGSMVFPAVTLCNINSIQRQSWINKSSEDLKLSTFLKETDGSSTEGSERKGDTILEMLKDKILTSSVKDTCLFNGRKCGPDNFTATLTSLGLCYSFNVLFGREEVAKVRLPGTRNGLVLHLSLHSNGDLAEKSYYQGIKILIHPPLLSPFNIDTFGSGIQPGTHNIISIKKLKQVRLPYPYASNCGVKDMKFMSKLWYTYSNCILDCKMQHIYEKCGCLGFDFMDIIARANVSIPECSARAVYSCVVREEEVFDSHSNACLKSCPLDCEETKYQAIISQLQIRDKTFAGKIKASAPGIQSEEEAAKFVHQNFISMEINYEEMSYFQETMTPIVEGFNVFSNVGGTLGLCLGVSILTMTEFLDFMVTICVIFWIRRKGISERTRKGTLGILSYEKGISN